MSTSGQFSSKNPTIKRILKEASEIANQPSADYYAAPLETDLFEWHFTLRGPPSPSPFEGGIYHGRIVLPPAYPLKPPSFRFLTPTGRFEVNREICLSISGHHEESWQPAWGIRTALIAIRSFMDTSGHGQLGGMEASEEVRKRMAGQSTSWKCPACSKPNGEIMNEQEEAVKEQGGDAKKEEVVPEELRLAYRDDLGKSNGKAAQTPNGKAPEPAAAEIQPTRTTVTAQTTTQQPQAPAQAAQVQAQRAPPPQEGIPAWIDKAIYGVVIALVILVWRRFLS
ncbi:hypothetical protein LTR36_002111 [Oleoguttula mirabilis]|uniref:UBC core domain-containing protein n=1 Tax=Oleoguttula mirabilis TaxID=1507867 RepID=A0AAV9JMF3_9PEZI|nr:hypothetical protein LTR36_002111 [Oleoguttula mirabilis]